MTKKNMQRNNNDSNNDLPSSEKKKKPTKPSRKPSVLVSRQFNIADALNGYHHNMISASLSNTPAINNKNEVAPPHPPFELASNDTHTKPPTSPDIIPKKLIWKGRDGTPLPLIVPERLHSSKRKSIEGGEDKGDTYHEENGEKENYTIGGASMMKRLDRSEDIFAHFEKYRFDHDNNDVNDEIMKVAQENISVPWIAEVMKDVIVNGRLSGSAIEESNLSLDHLHPCDDEFPFSPNNDTHRKGTLEIVLSETETMESFSLPSSVISSESAYYKEVVKDQNEEYEQACTRQRHYSPKRFTERPAQTFHSYKVNGWSQTDLKFKSVGVGCDAHSDDSDVLNKMEEIKNFVEEVTSAAMMTDGCIFDVSGGYKPGDKKFCPKVVPKTASYCDIKKAKATQKFHESKSIRGTIAFLERAIQQNNYKMQQVKYRGVASTRQSCMLSSQESTATVNEKGDGCLKLLFRLECELTAGMNTTDISWNKYNTDVFAAGYGTNQFSPHEKGLVILWSIRNPAFAEKFYEVSSPVTAIDFASKKPQMLAVGLFDGRILVYDISSQHDSNTPLVDSASCPGRHMSAVSKLSWVKDGHQDLSEKLVSVSIDGRVLEWSLKKGLSSTPLMTLKRNDPHLCKGKLPNLALGLSMDFLKDGKTYITGTDDGSLYYCSRSYVGRPILVSRPHQASLTALQYSPSFEDIFITAASDSKVKVHLISKKEDTIKEMIEIHPCNLIGAVTDISWSPKKSTLFVLIAQDKRLEIWDMASSVLDPIVSLKVENGPSNLAMQERTRSVVKFSIGGDMIVVGDDNGGVEIFQIMIPQGPDDEPASLLDILQKHPYKTYTA